MCGTGYAPDKEFTAHRIKQYTERGIGIRWDYTFEDFSPAFRQTPLATYFADMFAERNAHADLDSIVRQFHALATAGRRRSLRARRLPVDHPERQRGRGQVGLRPEGANSELRDAGPPWRRPCVPHGAAVAVRRYMIEFLRQHGLFAGSTPAMSSERGIGDDGQ